MSTRAAAEVVSEFVPTPGSKVHGVTFDGKLVWYARDGELVAFDPEQKAVVKRLAVPAANAGTAWDGENIYQVAGRDILVVRPEDGRVLRTMKVPGTGMHSGMAYADGYLFVAEYHDAKIHKIDAKTGELKKTLRSDRFVTGVSVVGGALWHGVSGDGGPQELRRLADDGTVEEVLEMPASAKHVAGVEGDGKGGFWCGGEEGKLRYVRKKAS